LTVGFGGPSQSASLAFTHRCRLTTTLLGRAAESAELARPGTPTLSIAEVANGLISTIEFFSDDQLEAAITRLEELSAP
ncbi:MAG: hypothetical protein QNM02_11785, partial [Acidimicrobiia bacterium]|nr:hypothetical protein [Acidimicrobiia bacterium]